MTESRDQGLDRLLDRAVLPGYSRLGYALRRRQWPDDDPRPGALAGRTALVTGAGSGLGEAAAVGLARLGAQVHLLVRSPERASASLDRVAEAARVAGLGGYAQAHRCDVSDPEMTEEFAAAFCARGDGAAAVDILVHNAGVMPAERTESVDGHELSVATHVLGPVRLTERLLPALRRSPAGARVIFVTSGGMYTQELPVEDPEFLGGRYRGAVAYARSKRMQVELAPVLARRWAPDRVSVYATHPGWADTPGIAAALPGFRTLLRPLLRSPEEGADTAVWLAATEPAVASGSFWHDRRQRPTSYLSGTRPGPEDISWLTRWTTQNAGLGDN
ncbi:SDR family NAD(P)-dependent oxidoreductase [Mycolicibacterium brumae]|uniref:Dehydrogenase n=1 Tax=Mycolicibacterium brumae TaxID=85968 RepID=A0A2G5PB61_9MYCO|nr:SDR family NAD(P)-dependent oxidoreductase [Mycolicibacterium brumae]MCV7192928.1 SDR family NAD(P)-dependent oxidoreductase [Mycolicibacterium brumae]PIB75233.1 dehydrogenase [Mycolicibacterium brumae]RWA23517.1 hypothetical protein MBRU_01450 [Mycolicibacterium brumae DSM 44177]UWW08553.1 SDR family NAD(P)-dependent oxidoreductase [Mycolicibacterium brumae]